MSAWSQPFGVAPSEFLSLVPPFVWGRPTTILNNVIYSAASTPLSRSSFGGLARLDCAMHNYRDNLGSLYHHPDLTLTLDKVLRNVIMSAYAHYIDLWPMNGACLGHRAILMQSMLKFAMHYSRYRHRQCYLIMQCSRRGLPPSTLLPAIDLTALLTNKEENLKPEQMNMSHVSIMELLDDPDTPFVC